MSAQYKISCRVYSAWNYQKEIEDLNRASENGWQLVRGGCFFSRFVKNPDLRYRYQLDYRRVEDWGRYLETYREQGWEYVNSTFNGWHYFRKLYDPSLPEEAYEIFTDRQSLHEMNSRWARIALAVGSLIGVLAVIFLIRMIFQPNWAVLTLLLTFAVESGILIRGGLLMRDPEQSRVRRWDGVLLAALFSVMVIGSVTGVVLTEMRPNLNMGTFAEGLWEPMGDNLMTEFEVKYADFYYLDADVRAKTPFSFALLDSDGGIVYTASGEEIHEKNVRLRLEPGRYEFSVTTEDGFNFRLKVD